MKSPIFVYPDPNKPYILFTDTLKYARVTVLTLEYATIIDDKTLMHQHPILSPMIVHYSKVAN